jgi:hypothetical protein
VCAKGIGHGQLAAREVVGDTAHESRRVAASLVIRLARHDPCVQMSNDEDSEQSGAVSPSVTVVVWCANELQLNTSAPPIARVSQFTQIQPLAELLHSAGSAAGAPDRSKSTEATQCCPGGRTETEDTRHGPGTL